MALAPALAARQREPFEFVQVQIVPLQALGVPEPVQAKSPPRSQPKMKPPAAEKTEESSPTPERRAPAPERAPERQESSAPPARDDSQQSTGVSSPSPAQRRGSPLGSPLATSQFGTAVAGFDNPDFVYGYYVEQMLAMIGSNWVRPSVDDDVEMTIHFRIASNGELTEVEIVEPSGHPSFDLAGLRAVRLASPLPPLPKSFPHSSLGVNLIIR